MPGTVAIMQPYFIPYAGYFRLIAQSDLFVLYDCVQFPRRGWVHRNQMVDVSGVERWLTLPLQKAPQEALISELTFSGDAQGEMGERLRPFDLERRRRPELAPILERLERIEGRPVDYIIDLLEAISVHLGLRWNVVRSSELNVPQTFRGQDRIIEIARRVGAEAYLNAPGGRDLYQEDDFAQAGLSLRFLPPYAGKGGSILERLLDDDLGGLRASILSEEQCPA